MAGSRNLRRFNKREVQSAHMEVRSSQKGLRRRSESESSTMNKRQRVGSFTQRRSSLRLVHTEPMFKEEKDGVMGQRLQLARRIVGVVAMCVPFCALFGSALFCALHSLAECFEAWQDVCNFQKCKGIRDLIEKSGKAVKRSAGIVNLVFPNKYTLLLAAIALCIECCGRITKSVPTFHEKTTSLISVLGQGGQMLTDMADLSLLFYGVSGKKSLPKKMSQIGKAFTKMESALQAKAKIEIVNHSVEKTAANMCAMAEKSLEAVANFLYSCSYL